MWHPADVSAFNSSTRRFQFIPVSLPARSRAWRGLAAAGLQALLIGAALYGFLHGWRRDFHVPLSFWFDGLFYFMQSKSTVDNGWWWFNPMLGSPFGLDQLAFPANSNVDQLIVWAVSRVVPDALTAINLSWVLLIALSGWTASWCMRQLGVSYTSSIVAGTLFALSPYALIKNLAHFGMVTYLVPFVCALALQLATGRLSERGYWRIPGIALLAGSAMLGFNYVYYAFFGCFFIVAAVVLGVLIERRRTIARAGAVCLAVLLACSFLNLAPSLYSWSRHGKPLVVDDKVPGHAELFGLKIRTLISPASPHLFPLFQHWVNLEAVAQYPIETENSHARLGVVGALGFLGLIGILLVPSAAERLRDGPVVLGASRLTAAGLFLATVGGFGSVFNLLVNPEIRVYARIAPFIAFFALLAVAMFMDAFFKSRRLRTAVAAGVLFVGLLDQSGAASGMNAEYASSASQLASLEPFVRRLENRLPANAMVLQLPFRTYLNGSTIARMEPYEHFKLYLVSRQLRWSYPALSNEQVAWQSGVSRLDPARLPYQLARQGFAAMTIDRYGYHDAGAAVIAAVRGGLRDADLIAETDRYIAFDIRSLAGALDDAEVTSPADHASPSSVCAAQPAAQPLIAVDNLNTMRLPPGAHLRIPRSGAFKVVGWAVDPARQSAAWGVDVVVDQTTYPSLYGNDRGDVAAYFGNPAYSQIGFAFAIEAERLGAGSHTVSLRVISAAGDCFYQGPQYTITID
jgi:phosphoglycerol transferase